EITRALKNVDKSLFAVAALIFLSTPFVLARRLELIFAAEDARISFLDASNLTFVGYFFNNFLPTSVGGDIVKAMCATRVTGEGMKSVTCVLMDRILGLFTFVLIPSFSLLFFLKNVRNPAVPVIIYSLLGGSVVFFVVLFHRGVARQFRFLEAHLNRLKIGESLRRVYDGLHHFKNHKGVVVQAILLSLIGQSVSVFVVVLVAQALGSRPPVLHFYLLIPIIHLISMLPSLNGLGIRESAYIYFLKPYLGREVAAAIGILWLGLLLMLSVIGGIVYLLRHDYHIRFKGAGPVA
ncbi:MAG: flippase-like domain-containing protein, partial [Candidatus Omnitrophica bacterium]|nr:flippase-like domain-containing protein [Candidatus Omnitrophota bacterium]